MTDSSPTSSPQSPDPIIQGDYDETLTPHTTCIEPADNKPKAMCVCGGPNQIWGATIIRFPKRIPMREATLANALSRYDSWVQRPYEALVG